jgi:hypothetical protein
MKMNMYQARHTLDKTRDKYRRRLLLVSLAPTVIEENSWQLGFNFIIQPYKSELATT